ncbi:MAG: CsbD family protein [Dehalococcoidia bacterium]|nr:CsbD family protein [Dehalococcoidia bacterium]
MTNQSVDKWKGRGKQVAGKVKQDTATTESERRKGKVLEVEGKVQEGMGKIKEKIKKALK